MSEQNGTNGAQPLFDFSNFSWRDSRNAIVLQSRINKAIEAHDVEGIEAGYLEIERFFAKVLISLPREWLVRSAPADIDWSDPDSMQWVRGDKSLDLLNALQEANSTEETTKNSPAASS